ncbi:MAG TPA: hypothetical protein VL326_01715 [Kofleriaceae bacterium]|nr:hypothetical protein [Kofleriaceae bacterium]
MPTTTPSNGSAPAAPDSGVLARLREIVSGPLKLLPEAIQAVPAVKYALATLAVAGCVAVGVGYFKNPKVALVAMIVGFVLMGLMVIFARVAKLPGRALKLPAVVFAWTCLLLFIVWGAGMTSSVFVGWPLKLSLFSSDDDTPFALIVPDKEAVAMMTPPRTPFVVTIEGNAIELHSEGVLIGDIKSLPDDTRERYRSLVQAGEPERYRVKLSNKIVNSVKVTYDGKPCRRPDLNPEGQKLWVLALDSCE